MLELKKIGATLIVVLCMCRIYAIDGIMDRSFAMGQAYQELPICKAVAVGMDEKIFIAGYVEAAGKKTFALARLLASGMLDHSFGNDGVVITSFTNGETASSAQAVMVDAQGKIVAAGFTNGIGNMPHACLARYNSDGSLDKSFFGGRGIFRGTVITTFGGLEEMSHINGLIETNDQKIIAVGGTCENKSARFAVARYNANGSLDMAVRTQFDSSSNDEAFAVAFDAQQKIVIAGSSCATGVKTFALARYHADGSLDESFCSGNGAKRGTAVTNFMCGETEGVARAVCVQADGKIVAGGHTNAFCADHKNCHFALARYTQNGMLDTQFGSDDGAMPGTLVTNFGNEKASSGVNALVMQADNKIVAGGYAEFNNKKYFALARYDSDGECDYTFNGGGAPNGKVLSRSSSNSSDEIFGLALCGLGDIVAVGRSKNNALCHGAVARYICDQDMSGPQIIVPGNNQVVVEGTKVILKGMAHSASRIQIYLDDKYLGVVQVKKDMSWDYKLPALTDGRHSLQICERYDAGHALIPSEKIEFNVDQHPAAINQVIECQGQRAMKGALAARGASGTYMFRIVKENNCKVALMDDGSFTVNATIPCGQASFEFEVEDKLTHCVSNGMLSLEVREIPLAGSAALNTAQNKELQANLEPFTMGGQKPYIFALMKQCSNGTFTLDQDGSFIFVPHLNFVGKSDINFVVTDTFNVTSDPGYITIQVHPIPRAKEYTILECANKTIHGQVGSYAYEGRKPYSFAVGHRQNHCTVTMEKDGAFICVPEHDYIGQASFEYMIIDARGYSSQPCVVTIDLYEDLQRPLSLYEGQMHGDLSTMRAESGCKYELYNAPEGLQLQLNANGEFTFALASAKRDPIEFMYKVTDAVGVGKIKKIRILCLKEPVAHSVVKEINGMSCIEGNLNELIVEGFAPFQYKILSAKNGKINCKADGSYSFMPRFDVSETAEFTYVAVDANNHSSNVGKVEFQKIIRSITN